MKSVLILFACLTCCQALAFGRWLEAVPYGGVELGGTGAQDRPTIEAELGRLAETYRDRPKIVWRTKALVHVFDHVRLAVNTNDLFVHWHADSRIFESSKNEAVRAFAESAPRHRYAGAWLADDGGFNCRLDTSHTCPDWRSVLALGPKGLAERARVRRRMAKTDDERLFLDCVAEVYDGLSRECLRWADFAAEKGMTEVAAVLRENAAHEPRTFREALQTKEWLRVKPIPGAAFKDGEYVLVNCGTTRLPRRGMLVLGDRWGTSLDMRNLGRYYDPTYHHRQYEFWGSVRLDDRDLLCDRVYLVNKGMPEWDSPES